MTLVDLIKKLLALSPSTDQSVIIDGGCNVGQFAQLALKSFPKSEVLSFEPDPDTSLEARRNVGDQPRHELMTAALGAEKGNAEWFSGPVSATNSLLPRPESDLKAYYPKEAYLEGGRTVEVVTLDEECSKRGIERIDLLKLDLQGGELSALKGAENMLRSNRIQLVLAEAVFIKKYQDQPLLWEVWQYLEQFGYSFYTMADIKIGLYGAEEATLRNTQWNQCDVIFLSAPIREALDRDQ